jgi:hypothetical protein
MTLTQAIKIIEGVSGREVTSIRFSFDRTQIIYQLNFGEDQFLEL